MTLRRKVTKKLKADGRSELVNLMIRQFFMFTEKKILVSISASKTNNPESF